MSDANDNQTNGPDRSSFQTEAQRLAEAARGRASDVFEEVKINSNQLVDKVRELIEEGNVRRIAIKKGERTLVEIPLTVGAGAAAAVALFNPLIAGIGAVAALLSEVTLVIQREGAEDVDLADAARDALDDAKAAVKKATGRADASGESVANVNAGDAAGDASGGDASSGSDAGSSGDEPSKTVGRSASSGDSGSSSGGSSSGGSSSGGSSSGGSSSGGSSSGSSGGSA